MFIGIDGGGTKCKAALCDKTGKFLGVGASGPANVMTNPELAVRSILDASYQALAQAGCSEGDIAKIPAYMGLAGANVGNYAENTKGELPFKESIIESDAYISLEGAIGSGDGAVAILGTGAVYVYRKNGVVSTAGGWGLILADQGGGAWLGKKMLEEVLLSYDNVQDKSSLCEYVLAEFSNNPQVIVEYANQASPKDFGLFAPAIFEFADKKDAIALKIVDEALESIEKTLSLIAADDQSFCLLGGLGPVYLDLLDDKYKRRVQSPIGDALSGAVRLAVKHFN